MESEEGIVGASDLYSVYQMGFEKSSDLQWRYTGHFAGAERVWYFE